MCKRVCSAYCRDEKDIGPAACALSAIMFPHYTFLLNKCVWCLSSFYIPFLSFPHSLHSLNAILHLRYGSVQTSGKQMLKLSLQDSGGTKCVAAELERIPQLSMNTLVGTSRRVDMIYIWNTLPHRHFGNSGTLRRRHDPSCNSAARYHRQVFPFGSVASYPSWADNCAQFRWCDIVYIKIY